MGGLQDNAAVRKVTSIIQQGDVREVLRRWIAEGVKVQMCVTSPPYWGLRNYGVPGQLGLEPTPVEYVANLVEVFRLVRELLADDGTLWLNLGDSYATSGGGTHKPEHANPGISQSARRAGNDYASRHDGLKPKDLVGIPWRVAFALQADGWYLRQDIIWSKPNPMPESTTDRCTKAHEYIFLLSKKPHYYYNAAAIAEPLASVSVARAGRADLRQKEGWVEAYHGNPPKGFTRQRYAGSDKPYTGISTKDYAAAGAQDASVTKARIVNKILSGEITTRNKRSVWSVTVRPYKGAHFATFPPALIEPCILAGSRPSDTVLDPFGGSGTTGMVAMQHGREFRLIELNPDYVKLAEQRIYGDMFK